MFRIDGGYGRLWDDITESTLITLDRLGHGRC